MSNETLLIVEDNQVLRDGLREMLTFEGFTVLTAANGREALQQMNAVSPDLILSDITMPEMDGYTFFNEVRARLDWVTIPFIFLTARAEQDDIMTGKNLGAEDYLIKPLRRDQLVSAVRGRLNRSRQITMSLKLQAYEASLTVLANAIDHYTQRHTERVTDLAVTLGLQLGWSEHRLEHLRLGAILHDIGKAKYSPEMLEKTTPLTESEWIAIKRHPVYGAEMIQDIPYLVEAAPIIRHHHEWWDGSGYPDGLAGETIPPGARLVAVADSFDAMTSRRPYSAARSPEAAFAEIQRCSGGQYDPAVVAAFQRAWHQGQIDYIMSKWHSGRPADGSAIGLLAPPDQHDDPFPDGTAV